MLPSSSIGAQEPIITTLCIRRRHVECPWPSDRHRPSGHKVIEIVSLIFAESLSLNSSDTLRIARTVQSKFYQINHLFMYAAANSKKIGIQLFLTRGYAKRRNGFLLGLRYANVSLAHSGVESS